MNPAQREQALPVSEAAREAAALASFAKSYEHHYRGQQAAREQWAEAGESVQAAFYAKSDPILAAAVDADPRLKAFLRLAALSDEELVERVARALVPNYRARAFTEAADRHTARKALAALGLPVGERSWPMPEPSGSTGVQPSAEAASALASRVYRDALRAADGMGAASQERYLEGIVARAHDDLRAAYAIDAPAIAREAHAAGVTEGRAAMRDEIRSWARCQLPQHYDNARLGDQIADLIEARFPSEGTT